MLPFRAALDELEKLGAVSPEQARRSLDRLETLEQQKPTAGQVARYGALGAGAGVGIGALGDVIQGGGKLRAGGLRGMAANAVKGALSAGAIPLVQKHLDHRAEMGTLKKFVAQPET